MRNWQSFGRVRDTILADGSPNVTMIYPNAQQMRMCGLTPDEYNTLNLIEDENGEYLGWLDASKDGSQIVMVQNKQIFNIQFPNGHEAEVALGRGEAVPLRIEVIPNVA